MVFDQNEFLKAINELYDELNLKEKGMMPIEEIYLHQFDVDMKKLFEKVDNSEMIYSFATKQDIMKEAYVAEFENLANDYQENCGKMIMGFMKQELNKLGEKTEIELIDQLKLWYDMKQVLEEAYEEMGVTNELRNHVLMKVDQYNQANKQQE